MTEDYDREALAARVRDALVSRYDGNKRRAYTAAGMSPQTFNSALEGSNIRPDMRVRIERWLDEAVDGEQGGRTPRAYVLSDYTDAELLSELALRLRAGVRVVSGQVIQDPPPEGAHIRPAD